MKTLFILLYCCGIFMFSNAQNPALIGTWNIIQFNVGNNVEGEFMFEKKLKEASSVWDLFLMEDSKFKQISNMRGSGAMGTYEGTWKTSGNNLTLGLNIQNHNIDLIYTYNITSDTLILERRIPTGTIVTTFRRNNK